LDDPELLPFNRYIEKRGRGEMTQHEDQPRGHAHRDRHGAKQPERFDPAKAALLDDPARFDYMPPDKLIEFLDAPGNSRVIDFGAGTGTFAIELARRRPDLEVIAFDEQPEMLDMLRAKPAARSLSNLRPVLPGEMQLESSADRIVALNVLHELGDDALMELAGMLKRGGAALFVDWRADIERPVGPPRDHVYRPAEARRRVEGVKLRATERPPLEYHYVLVATKA
jgi:SAM-dependent methyltransferase